MKRLSILAALLLVMMGLQTAWGQGFRVYKSDGTVVQFSLRSDSIVFYDNVGSDADFGPFTPVNQCIAGTWITQTGTVTLEEDGTTDYVGGATYKFFPYQGNLVIYNTSGTTVKVLRVIEMTSKVMTVCELGSSSIQVWTAKMPISGTTDGHEWVDLGLPSGTKWATCDIGASKPETVGSKFAWGEVAPKDEYSWSTYMYSKGSSSKVTKYCLQPSYGYNDFKDSKLELDPEDDAATANWGASWHMPTYDQVNELTQNCSKEWTTLNNITGILVTGPSGGQIFFPSEESEWGPYGEYWTKILYEYDSTHAWYMFFIGDTWECDSYYRYNGRRVRAVCQ